MEQGQPQVQVQVQDREELTRRVQSLIARETALPLNDIVRSTSLTELGVDSLDVLKIAAVFEQVFNITITTAELMRINTVGDIVTELERKVSMA